MAAKACSWIAGAALNKGASMGPRIAWAKKSRGQSAFCRPPPTAALRAPHVRDVSRSERDLVVHVLALAGAHHGRLAFARRREFAARSALIRTRPGAAAATIQHGEGRIEALQHHLGAVALDIVLVGPLAGLQLAFEVSLGAFLEVLLRDLAQAFAEDHHPVPLGFFLAVPGRLVAPAFRGRHAQLHDRPAVLRATHLRILAEIADQNHLVDAACHDLLHSQLFAEARPAPWNMFVNRRLPEPAPALQPNVGLPARATRAIRPFPQSFSRGFPPARSDRFSRSEPAAGPQVFAICSSIA